MSSLVRPRPEPVSSPTDVIRELASAGPVVATRYHNEQGALPALLDNPYPHHQRPYHPRGAHEEFRRVKRAHVGGP